MRLHYVYCSIFKFIAKWKYAAQALTFYKGEFIWLSIAENVEILISSSFESGKNTFKQEHSVGGTLNCLVLISELLD